jgi:hypothetical protein
VEGLSELRRGIEHGALLFTLAGDEETVELTRALADVGVGIRALVREQTTLEELFFRLTESAEEPHEVEAAVA